MDPLPDGAHAVGAPLRPPSGRPPLRAHRVSESHPPTIRQHGPQDPSTLPDHPHIQHANLGITSIYLEEIDSSEIISTVHGRPSPTISATAGLEMTR